MKLNSFEDKIEDNVDRALLKIVKWWMLADIVGIGFLALWIRFH